MNKVKFIVLDTMKEVVKYFDNVVEQRKFLLRCKYSNKVFVLGYTCDGTDEYEYLEFGR